MFFFGFRVNFSPTASVPDGSKSPGLSKGRIKIRGVLSVGQHAAGSDSRARCPQYLGFLKSSSKASGGRKASQESRGAELRGVVKRPPGFRVLSCEGGMQLVPWGRAGLGDMEAWFF